MDTIVARIQFRKALMQRLRDIASNAYTEVAWEEEVEEAKRMLERWESERIMARQNYDFHMQQLKEGTYEAPMTLEDGVVPLKDLRHFRLLEQRDIYNRYYERKHIVISVEAKVTGTIVEEK